MFAAHGGHGFEDVDFAGELRGVAEASVGDEDESAGGDDLGWLRFAFGEEGEFGAFLAAAEEPDLEAAGSSALPVGRDDEAVGLEGVVEFRAVAAQDEAGGIEPRDAAGAEVRGAFAAEGEKVARSGDFFGGEKLVVAERPVDGFVENLDVGEEGEERGVVRGGEFGAEGGDFGGERGGGGGELGAGRIGNCDAGGREAFRGRRGCLRWRR